ncbi:MAG: hypothetical protein ACRDJN_21055, partial [Chloroflexota bacterium]
MRLPLPKLPRMPRKPERPAPRVAPAPPALPAVQTTYGRAVAALRDTLVLQDGRCRAVLEVAGLPVAALPGDEQETVLAGLLRLFAGLTHPVQLVVRTEAVD